LNVWNWQLPNFRGDRQGRGGSRQMTFMGL
jgi:hypothetical protein